MNWYTLAALAVGVIVGMFLEGLLKVEAEADKAVKEHRRVM